MKKTLSYLLATLVFNTAIAGVLSLLMRDIPFSHHLICSQSIGLSILAINLVIIRKVRNHLLQLAALALTLPISVVIGVTLAFSLTGLGDWNTPRAAQAAVIGLFFGLIGIVTVLLSERIAAEIQQRELLRSESEKRQIEAHLKLLQAQIEPHFLFNTLANVSSLIDRDPGQAKALLERLNDWLRVALARTRSERTTLGDELDMLENYLQIMKIRFGERLRWQFAVPGEIRMQPFPPMLLQPLVENAVRHGIEPKLGGGEIGIHVGVDHACLNIDVSDDGMGLSGNSTGTGLSNVRARLASLFGDAGRLTLKGNVDGGTTATLTLPIAEQGT